MVNAPTPHQPYKTPNNYQRGGPGYYDKASRPPTAAEGLSARPKDVNRHDNTGGLVGGFDRGHNDSNETDVRRRDSIPRKQVSTSGHTPSGSVTSGSPTTAWPSTESWDQQAPPVPQHYMPLSQQPRYQAPTAAPHQHSSSSRQTQSNVPSRQQDRHEEPPPRTSSSTYKPQQLKHSMPHSQHASHQDSPSPTQQYDHARSAQSPSQHEVHPDYALDRQYDGRVAPLAIRSKHASKNVARGPAPEDVVERAKTNTYDTEVIEKIAPGQWCKIQYPLVEANKCMYSCCSRDRAEEGAPCSGRSHHTRSPHPRRLSSHFARH